MKKNKFLSFIILTLLLILYLFISHRYNIYIPCIFHEITGLYCPGCGITRMLFSILTFNFYQAFRYNPLLFILFPFAVFLTIDNFYSLTKKKFPIYKKINSKIWIVLIVILVIYGILRNIYPPLAPLKIK